MDGIELVSENGVWGWAPVITLVMAFVTILVVINIARWAWNHVMAPVPVPDINTFRQVHVQPDTAPLPAFLPPAYVGRAEVALREAVNVVFGYPTAEYVVVFDETEERVDTILHDELGSWDPDTADWLSPAVYIETVHHTLRSRPGLLPDSHKVALASDFRRRTLRAVDAVLTGS